MASAEGDQLKMAQPESETKATEAGAQPFKPQKPGEATIKSEFLMIGHKPQLMMEYVSEEMKQKLQQNASPENKDEADGTEPPTKKVKLTGRNKKRPRERGYNQDKLCANIIKDQPCAYGENCKFSHDVEKFLEEKLEDIGENCYIFEKYGHCPYGIACRFGSKHITEDFKNKDAEGSSEVSSYESTVKNIIDREVLIKLRKKTYDFVKANKIVKEIEREALFAECAGNKSVSKAAANSGIKSESVGSLESTPTVSSAESTAVGSTNTTVKTSGCVTDEGMIKLRPAEKKQLNFKDKLYLAPLTTVGNLPFRRICKRFGADITCSEMSVCYNLLQGSVPEWALLKRHESEDFFGVQVCGGFPDTMTRCAQVLTDKCEMDFVDINCGCPIDLIFKKGEGCGLMGRPKRFESIVKGMTSVLDVPLTVKMRTGIMEHKRIAHNLIPRARDLGVSLVTLHGRSREGRYTKLADWDYINECSTVGAPMPVFGNGDILSYEDANLHREQTGVSGIMIARGALIKPWVFTEIKEQRHWDISSQERFSMIKDFANYGLEHWGSDTRGVETTRRFMLEWLSFLYRYVPVGLLEKVPQKINERPPYYRGRDEMETLLASSNCGDWIKISEMLLGPVPEGFTFLPKHKANAYK